MLLHELGFYEMSRTPVSGASPVFGRSRGKPYAPNIAPIPPGATIAALQSRSQVVTKACIIIAATCHLVARAGPAHSWASHYAGFSCSEPSGPSDPLVACGWLA